MKFSWNTKKAKENIKWSRNLKRRVSQGRDEKFDLKQVRKMYRRPFLTEWFYDSLLFVDERGSISDVFASGVTVPYIAVHCISSQNELCAIANFEPPDLNLLKRGNGGTYYFPSNVGSSANQRIDNITDWAQSQFKAHYSAKTISKEAIFHYVYAVLHDPIYREKYALNLKREFPRIPFYGTTVADFKQWGDWGKTLMDLHINYESVKPTKLKRTDAPDEKARKNADKSYAPKAMLKADKVAGRITLDSETTLNGVPEAAWAYKLGNRSALEWILDQYKEKKPKDPTIREKFDTYRFADYKEKVIDLLMRVTTVSVRTQEIVEAMKVAKR